MLDKSIKIGGLDSVIKLNNVYSFQDIKMSLFTDVTRMQIIHKYNLKKMNDNVSRVINLIFYSIGDNR